MFDMVSTVTLDNPGLSYRVLFATERQAQIIGNNPDTLEKLAAQFRTEETAKPKVVINLLTSLGTSQLREKRKQHPDEDEQHRLDMFMRHVLLPIAEQTNALVLCDAVADRCILADSFVRMCRVRHAAWNKKMPFTVVGVTTMNELDKRSGERCFWRELMGKCKGAWEDEWKKYYKNRQLNIDKSIPTGTGGVGDIQPLLPNLLLWLSIEQTFGQLLIVDIIYRASMFAGEYAFQTLLCRIASLLFRCVAKPVRFVLHSFCPWSHGRLACAEHFLAC